MLIFFSVAKQKKHHFDWIRARAINYLQLLSNGSGYGLKFQLKYGNIVFFKKINSLTILTVKHNGFTHILTKFNVRKRFKNTLFFNG
jgi:hypothetical protein